MITVSAWVLVPVLGIVVVVAIFVWQRERDRVQWVDDFVEMVDKHRRDEAQNFMRVCDSLVDLNGKALAAAQALGEQAQALAVEVQRVAELVQERDKRDKRDKRERAAWWACPNCAAINERETDTCTTCGERPEAPS